MPDYRPPIKELLFGIENVVEYQKTTNKLKNFHDIELDDVRHILDEAGKISSQVVAPLNKVGDMQACRVDEQDDEVHTPMGWGEAYRQFVEGGWNTLPFDIDKGGQGLPWVVAAAVQEMVTSASMAFSLCPLLNQAAIELLCIHGSQEQQEKYLPKVMTGEWTGTMNLTEPQAGSDLANIKMKAWKDGEHYRVRGQKIYITYGDHDMTENIIHMVLARLPEAPEGIKGISLFLVPKILINDEGDLGDKNEVHCVSLEHKLGIHGSPTAVMSYGDQEGATAYLVGEENRGIEYMFTMMNNARLGVGVQGLAISERAYQQALDYAKERKQGRLAVKKQGRPTDIVEIVEHPDVRRMLAVSKVKIDAMRWMVLYCAHWLDGANHHEDENEKAKSQKIVDLLIPVVKSWCTDNGCEITSLALQVHGGMGYIEETGAAQHFRDARIAPIYEGTNGIQANDLILRKVGRDKGKAMELLIDEIEKTIAHWHVSEQMSVHKNALQYYEQSIQDLKAAREWVVENYEKSIENVCYAANSFLNLVGTVLGAHLAIKGAIKAYEHIESNQGDQLFYESKINNALIYCHQVLRKSRSYLEEMQSGHIFDRYVAI